MGANEDGFYPEPFTSQPYFSNRQPALSDKASRCFARASGDKDRPFKQQTYGIESQEEQKRRMVCDKIRNFERWKKAV